MEIRAEKADRFKKRYDAIEELEAKGKAIRNVVILHRYGRFSYYLITKERYYDKQLLDDLEKSLWNMKGHALQNDVCEISMPAIGYGLDKISWTSLTTLEST